MNTTFTTQSSSLLGKLSGALLKSILISLILVLGVSNAWAGRVYFKPYSAWASSDARLAAYFYGDGDNWKDLKKVGDYYVCDIPEGGGIHISYFVE